MWNAVFLQLSRCMAMALREVKTFVTAVKIRVEIGCSAASHEVPYNQDDAGSCPRDTKSKKREVRTRTKWRICSGRERKSRAKRGERPRTGLGRLAFQCAPYQCEIPHRAAFPKEDLRGRSPREMSYALSHGVQ